MGFFPNLKPLIDELFSSKFDKPTGTNLQYIAGDGTLLTFPTFLSSDSLIATMFNQTGSTVPSFKVVYINGVHGNLPTLALAKADSESTSSKTYAITSSSISNNNSGTVVTDGKLKNINTSAFAEGDSLWLSPTTAGGVTTTKPSAPNHAVFLGTITRVHANQGEVQVRIQNGFELQELHNVAIDTPLDSQSLIYDNSTSLWKNSSKYLDWFTFIWKLFSGFTIAELRLLTNSQLALVTYFSCNEQGRIKDWYYDSTDTTSSDNNGTILVTISGKRLKTKILTTVTPENFGAKGDGISDDTVPIQNAIDYLYNLSLGGILLFSAKIYCATYLQNKKNVTCIGSDKGYLTANLQDGGTTLKCISNTFIPVFIDLYNDRTYSFQTGELTRLNKNNPNFKNVNLTIDANGIAKFGCYVPESWGFKIDNCKYINPIVSGLAIVDCNEFDVTNSIITNLLSISNADYSFDNNQYIGSTKFPAKMIERQSNGKMSAGNAFFGGNKSQFFNFNVTNITNDTLTFNIINYLTSNPNWSLYLSDTASMSFIESTQTLNLTSDVEVQAVTGLNTAVLVKGKSYTLTGTAIFTGVSSTRVVTFNCGNATQEYGRVTLTNNVSTNINISFTFNPLLNNSTNPLKIIALIGSGLDNISFSNLRIEAQGYDELNGYPLILDYLDTINANVKTYFPYSECFYPKFISNNQVKLFNNLYNNANNTSPISIYTTLTSLTNVNLSVPNAVAFFGGKATSNNIISSIKYEDIIKNGVVFRGSYKNNFTGNNITKAISAEDAVLCLLEKGATKNIIDANIIGARINVTNTDISFVGIKLDQYSGGNILSGNESSDNQNTDILDLYSGETSTQNQISARKNLSTFSFQNKSTDYNTDKICRVINTGSANGLQSNNPIITDSEFTLFFKDVKFNGNAGDVCIFQQKDITAGSQDGRLSIKRNSSSKKIYITINTTIIVETATNSFLENEYSDIIITKDILNTWSIWKNGILLVTTTASISTQITQVTGVKSYVGSGDITQGDSFEIAKFAYFSDILSETEIKHIVTSDIIPTKNISLLNSKLSGVSSFSGITNGSISSSTVGLDGTTNDLKLDFSVNNIYPFNISSSTLKGKLLRLSLYVKSSGITRQVIDRGISKTIPINNTYNKIVTYLYPNNTNISVESLVLNFGELQDFTFGKNFVSKSGTVYIDYLNVSCGNLPVKCLVDFSYVTISDRIYNFTFTEFGNSNILTVAGLVASNIITNKLDITPTTGAIGINLKGNTTDSGRFFFSSPDDYTNSFVLRKSGNNLIIATGGTPDSNSGTSRLIVTNSGTLQPATNEGVNLGASGTRFFSGYFTNIFSTVFNVLTGTNGGINSATLSSGTVTITNSRITSTTELVIWTKNNAGTPANYFEYSCSSGTATIAAKNMLGTTETGCNATIKYLIINPY